MLSVRKIAFLDVRLVEPDPVGLLIWMGAFLVHQIDVFIYTTFLCTDALCMSV